ncbi:MAG: SpoIIE family protein phosphatase [Desulfobacterales bacterium]
MTKTKLLHLKNEMLAANILANLIGVLFIQILLESTEDPIIESIFQIPIVDAVDSIFTPMAFLFVTVTSLIYERPIRAYLTAKFNRTSISPDLESSARRRILNEPFALIIADFSMWLLAAIIYPVMFWLLNTGPHAIQRSLINSLSVGIITVTVAFFLLEHVSQKRLAPHLFPHGGLVAIPKTLRIRIRTRMAALLFACNLIPLMCIILALHRITSNTSDADLALNQVRSAMITYAIIFILTGIYLTGLVSRNLTMPFREIIQALREVRNGRFDKKVQVTTNDEIGYTGDVINEMTEGLKERDRLRQSLDIAMEVQQHLLPKTDPKVESLDIAGGSIYCEETGGDYYDYLDAEQDKKEKIRIVVGDVSDHGIASALLMTTARAFLRQRASRTGNLNQIVTDVNRQLSRDVEDSGRFMTLFFCEINGQNKTIRWVNAGHDPAVIYDVSDGEFNELSGAGLPLGVSEKAAYQEYRQKLKPGQIILVGTDGIWETQNGQGQMFGKKRYRDIIRTHAQIPAKEILKTVITDLDKFCHPLQKEDDVTLVVIKVTS